MPDILLVEDDKTISIGLKYALEQKGYRVTPFSDALSALGGIRTKRFDLAILDICLPAGSGYEICRAVKDRWGTPVIFLTVLGEEQEVVAGFGLGADDYVTKPFRLRELLSRVEAVLRRTERPDKDDGIIAAGDVVIDTKAAQVTKNGAQIPLTALEYRLLLILAKNRGNLLTRNQLLEEIWDVGGDYVNDNTLTVYIKRLRDKIEDDPKDPRLIVTVRGLGYRLES